MGKSTQAGPVGEKDLHALLQRGETNPLISMRLEYQESNQLLTHYIGPAAGRPTKSDSEPWLMPDGRAYPVMLPTQASLRWSTKRPPLPTFPAPYREIVKPDPGTVWAVWDWSAIEARLVAYESGDREDIEAFEREYDIHTLTTCGMFRLERPPVLLDARLHSCEENASWRDQHQWQGKEDWRRVVSKTCRYALFYAKDEKAILTAKDVDKVMLQYHFTPRDMLKFGKMFLDSKPALTAWKRRTWAKAWQDHCTRTPLGSRRMLIAGTSDKKAKDDLEKQGLNHIIQGMVSLMMDLALIKICHPTLGMWGDCAYLVYQSHDSGKIAFPAEVRWWPKIKEIVEQPYSINGRMVPFPSSWQVITEHGHQCVSPYRSASICKGDRHIPLTPEEYFA